MLSLLTFIYLFLNSVKYFHYYFACEGMKALAKKHKIIKFIWILTQDLTPGLLTLSLVILLGLSLIKTVEIVI